MTDPTANITQADVEESPSHLGMSPPSPALARSDSPEWNRYLSLLSPMDRRAAIKAKRRGRVLTQPFPFWAHS